MRSQTNNTLARLTLLFASLEFFAFVPNDSYAADRQPNILFFFADDWMRYASVYADVCQHDGAYTRFQIGSPRKNPTGFTGRDWHPTDGRVIWKTEQPGDVDHTLKIDSGASKADLLASVGDDTATALAQPAISLA